MIDTIHSVAAWSSALVEFIGIGIITFFSIYTLAYALVLLLKRERAEVIFRTVRHSLGRAILLGLEFLVAGDIIHTVAVELTYETLGSLAIVVVIRTFLSFSLEVELTGQWPWHSSGTDAAKQNADPE